MITKHQFSLHLIICEPCCRQVGHDETIQVLVGDIDEDESMVPMTVGNDTWSDIRMRSFSHDHAVVGEPGAFWMFYFPRGAHPSQGPFVAYH